MAGIPGATLALLFLALGGVAAWDRALLRCARSPRAIEFGPEGTAVVVLASGEPIPVRAIGGIGVTGHWVALAALLRPARGILITTGMLGTADARILRLWALWGRTPGTVSLRHPEQVTGG